MKAQLDTTGSTEAWARFRVWGANLKRSTRVDIHAAADAMCCVLDAYERNRNKPIASGLWQSSMLLAGKLMELVPPPA